MFDLGAHLRRLRLRRGQSLAAVAAATGISVERQERIEGSGATPSAREHGAYARHFGAGGRVPVINRAPAGRPGDFEEPYPPGAPGYAYIDPPAGVFGPGLFAFVIVGDSMEPDYAEGDYAVCRPAPADRIGDGEAVFVRFGAARDHACTFKRCYRVDAARVELRPVNPRWRSEVVLKADVVRMVPVVAVVPRAAAPGPPSDRPDLESLRQDEAP